MGPEQMRIRLEPDGMVSVFTSQMPHGQGHETTFAQIAADEIGVPFEQVRVVAGDTDSAPMGFGTGGSRAATMAGGATLHTARRSATGSSTSRRISSRRARATSSSPTARWPCAACL